jgi:putative colanic acid biosysnthesis UDP-glucose lipid carrier transferase
VRLGASLRRVPTEQIETSLSFRETCPAERMLLTEHARKVNCSVAKRATDLILASLLILLSLPVFIAIAVAIKASSRGPVLSREQRCGAGRQVFWILKFRTVRVMDAKGNVAQARQNDERLTWIGHCLRCSGMDELPQLFNVLQGTMSFVGPRAHMPAMDDYYAKLIPDSEIRHFVRPGLTGLAQLNGDRAPSESLEGIARGLACDIAYIRNWSWMRDLVILLRTSMVPLGGDAI